MNIIKRIALIDASKTDNGFIEGVLTKNNIGYKMVYGYANKKYVAVIDTDNKLETIYHIAAKLGQKSFVVVDELRKAFSYDVLTGDVKGIGSLKTVTPLEANEYELRFTDGENCYAII